MSTAILRLVIRGFYVVKRKPVIEYDDVPNTAPGYQWVSCQETSPQIPDSRCIGDIPFTKTIDLFFTEVMHFFFQPVFPGQCKTHFGAVDHFRWDEVTQAVSEQFFRSNGEFEIILQREYIFN